MESYIKERHYLDDGEIIKIVVRVVNPYLSDQTNEFEITDIGITPPKDRIISWITLEYLTKLYEEEFTCKE